jgi:hypothetical protein
MKEDEKGLKQMNAAKVFRILPWLIAGDYCQSIRRLIGR